MNYLLKLLLLIFLCCGATHADFCQEIYDNLRSIIHKTEGIEGELESVVPFPDQGGSFINQVYLCCTDRGETFVLKVENANWQREKTLNEVLTLEYLDRYTSIPVPKVLAYECEIYHSLISQEYILMSRVKGNPLNHEFERIYADPDLYRHVLEQLADILAELKQQSFSSIGSLKCPDSLSLKCPIDFANLGYETPCNSFSEYARRWLNYYLHEMKSLKNSGHQNAKYFEKYIPQVEQLLLSSKLSLLDNPLDTFPFSHQDFVMKNILIEDATITAVLDWEWSGAAVPEFESKTGCDFLKTPKDVALFDSMLERRGVPHFFAPPSFCTTTFLSSNG
jgi:aminoglycoside phosphotransferase (APT) family kinase protein